MTAEKAYERVLQLLHLLTAEQLQQLKLTVIGQYQKAIPVVEICTCDTPDTKGK